MIASQEGVASQDDINAQYQQYYQQLAQQHAQHHGNPGGIKNRQDFADDIESFLGPDASVSNFLYKPTFSKQSKNYC